MFFICSTYIFYPLFLFTLPLNCHSTATKVIGIVRVLSVYCPSIVRLLSVNSAYLIEQLCLTRYMPRHCG